MRLIKLLIILVLIIIGAAFAWHNDEGVTLNYYFGSLDLPLSLLLIGTLIVGAVVGMLSAAGTILGLKRENASLRRKSKVVTEEVENLRAIPLKE
ncbi:MAG: LapA family protein [Gammaproteobacteria bacterium]|nr:LapA family protein [Gammaproteobacteria bacterium]